MTEHPLLVGRMGELVGLRITRVQVSDDDEWIVFTDENGRELRYQCFADCCSQTWISDIQGLDALLGNVVRRVVAYPERDAPDEENVVQEYVTIYSFTLETDHGRFDVEFRNGSNGYYGGSLEPVTDETWERMKRCGEVPEFLEVDAESYERPILRPATYDPKRWA